MSKTINSETDSVGTSLGKLMNGGSSKSHQILQHIEQYKKHFVNCDWNYVLNEFSCWDHGIECQSALVPFAARRGMVDVCKAFLSFKVMCSILV